MVLFTRHIYFSHFHYCNDVPNRVRDDLFRCYLLCIYVLELRNWPTSYLWVLNPLVPEILSTYQKDQYFTTDEVWLRDTTNTFFSLFFSSDCTSRIQTTLTFVGLVIIVTWFLLLNLTSHFSHFQANSKDLFQTRFSESVTSKKRVGLLVI